MCSFFLYCYRDHRDLHSFPTRRSSDLPPCEAGDLLGVGREGDSRPHHRKRRRWGPGVASGAGEGESGPSPESAPRSEEHTSELQSRLHLVCRLLLEKKKKQLYTSMSTH